MLSRITCRTRRNVLYTYRKKETHTCMHSSIRDTLILNWLLIHVNYHRFVYRDFVISYAMSNGSRQPSLRYRIAWYNWIKWSGLCIIVWANRLKEIAKPIFCRIMGNYSTKLTEIDWRSYGLLRVNKSIFYRKRLIYNINYYYIKYNIVK